MIQTLLMILGISNFYLITCESNKLKLLGFIIGTIAQPLWIYETINNSQYGMFILSIFYLIINIYGIYKLYKNKLLIK